LGFVRATADVEALVRVFSKPTRNGRDSEAGLGLMESIVALLIVAIVGFVILHLCRMGFSMYRLNTATSGIAEELEVARSLAVESRSTVSVFFDAKEKRFGLDRNGNGRLDKIEGEDLPDGVDIDENAVVIFARSGNLAPGTKQPNIIISNTQKSRRVSVSKAGVVEID